MATTVWRSGRAAAVAALAAITLVPGAASAQTPQSYVALGDSYSSGNGTFAPNLDVACYRSSYAYPALVAAQRPHTALTFVACQGATTDDIVTTQSRSLNAGTDFVSITIGGNDIGFGELVDNCAGTVSPNCKATVDKANAAIDDELPGKLDKAYAAIKADAPHARVVVLGYGRFFGTDLSCPAAQGITVEEAFWLNGIAEHLDTTTRDRATAAGFTYKSSLRSFLGHDVCASDPYLNGRSISAADAYHPTRSGHADGLAPEVRQVIG